MWVILAFVTATFLGFYDTSKKAALKDNAVLPALLLNTAFSTLIFSLLVDGSTACHSFHIHDEPHREKGGRRFQKRQMGVVRGRSDHNGNSEVITSAF